MGNVPLFNKFLNRLYKQHKPVVRRLPRVVALKPKQRKTTKTTPTKPPARTRKPAAKARKITYKPKDLFHPLPFPLYTKQREQHYQDQFKQAATLKIGLHESIFLKLIHRERRYEAEKKSIRTGIMRIGAIRYIRYKSLKKYRLIGYQQLQKMEALLNAYLAAKAPVAMIPPKGSPHFDKANKLLRYTGHFPTLFRNIGIITPTKELTTTQRFWLRTLFMSRWMRHPLGHLPLPTLMGATLYVDYNKAVVLFSKKAKRRLDALRELRIRQPGFPALRTLGWLFVQFGRPHMAIRSFRDALKQNPKDSQTKTLLDNLIKSPS
jgi:predicted Zn-dependent protease